MTLLAVEHPDWMLDAECTRAKPELFYPEPAGRSVTEAKAVCARCPVQAECLAWAIRTNEPWGIWGGQTPDERGAALRAELDRVDTLGRSSAEVAAIIGCHPRVVVRRRAQRRAIAEERERLRAEATSIMQRLA